MVWCKMEDLRVVREVVIGKMEDMMGEGGGNKR